MISVKSLFTSSVKIRLATSTDGRGKGRRQKNLIVADMSVNRRGGGGGANPMSATKIVFFPREKDEECSERNNMQKYYVKVLQGYPL